MIFDLWKSLVGRAVQPKVIENRVFEVSDAADAEVCVEISEPPSWHNEIGPISGFPCILSYVDSKGISSERLVTCQRLDLHNKESYLWAFCHTRKGVRQFKISRIQEISDTTTGETFESVDAFFRQFAFDNQHNSQPGWGLSVNKKADFLAVLNALVFMARCDKDYHPLERQSLESFISRFWLRMEASGEPDYPSILKHADKLAPDAEVFWVALNRCAEDSRLLKILKVSAREMIEADGLITDEEFYWGNKVDEFIQKIGVS